MRIISINVNGIRSAWSKGFWPWLSRQRADVVCIQEVKAQEPDLAPAIRAPKGFHAYFHCAEKRGYSGVALFCRCQPDDIAFGFGSREFDPEGRVVRADFGKVS